MYYDKLKDSLIQEQNSISSGITNDMRIQSSKKHITNNDQSNTRTKSIEINRNSNIDTNSNNNNNIRISNTNEVYKDNAKIDQITNSENNYGEIGIQSDNMNKKGNFNLKSELESFSMIEELMKNNNHIQNNTKNPSKMGLNKNHKTNLNINLLNDSSPFTKRYDIVNSNKNNNKKNNNETEYYIENHRVKEKNMMEAFLIGNQTHNSINNNNNNTIAYNGNSSIDRSSKYNKYDNNNHSSMNSIDIKSNLDKMLMKHIISNSINNSANKNIKSSLNRDLNNEFVSNKMKEAILNKNNKGISRSLFKNNNFAVLGKNSKQSQRKYFIEHKKEENNDVVYFPIINYSINTNSNRSHISDAEKIINTSGKNKDKQDNMNTLNKEVNKGNLLNNSILMKASIETLDDLEALQQQNSNIVTYKDAQNQKLSNNNSYASFNSKNNNNKKHLKNSMSKSGFHNTINNNNYSNSNNDIPFNNRNNNNFNYNITNQNNSTNYFFSDKLLEQDMFPEDLVLVNNLHYKFKNIRVGISTDHKNVYNKENEGSYLRNKKPAVSFANKFGKALENSRALKINHFNFSNNNNTPKYAFNIEEHNKNISHNLKKLGFFPSKLNRLLDTLKHSNNNNNSNNNRNFSKFI